MNTASKALFFQSVIDNDPGWKTTLLVVWDCITRDDIRRVKILASNTSVSVPGTTTILVVDGIAHFTAGGGSGQWPVALGGSGAGAGLIIVTDGSAGFTSGGLNYFFAVNTGGAGSAYGTVTMVDGNAEFTWGGNNYYFPVTPYP